MPLVMSTQRLALSGVMPSTTLPPGAIFSPIDAGANQIAPPRETRDGRRASERTRARLLRENDAVRGRIGDDTNAASCRARVRHCRSRADVARDRPRDC
jgi:hypothetical protein